MKDDEREVDWAPRKIRELQQLISGLQEGVEGIQERLSLLEGDEHITPGDWRGLIDRVAAVEGYPRLTPLGAYPRRVAPPEEIPNKLPEQITSFGGPDIPKAKLDTGFGRKYQRDLDDELDGIPDVHGRGTQERWLPVTDQFPKRSWGTKWPHKVEPGRWTPTVLEGESLEDVSLDRWIGEALGAASTCWKQGTIGEFDSTRVKMINDSLAAHVQEVIDRATKAVSPNPVQRGCRLCPGLEWADDPAFIEHLRSHVDQLSNQSAARRTSLELAEKRVRDYMNGHFSQGTIDGVVRALKGIPEIPAIAEYE